ncbi:Cationic amino acid transporter C-terminal domain-containing protein [Plasmodiophora brassicae]
MASRSAVKDDGTGAEPTLMVNLGPDACNQLKRTLTFFDGFAFVIGSLIGAGLFVSPGYIYKSVGPIGTLVAWTISGLLALAGALCYSELATLLVSAGSESTYLKAAFGRVSAFCYVFMLFVVIGPGALAAITGVCAVYLVSGLAWAVPDTPLVIQLVSIGLVVFIAGVNLAGSSSSALLQRVLLYVKFLTVGAVLLSAVIHRSVATPARADVMSMGNLFDGLNWDFVVYAIMKAVFAFNGFQMLAPLSEEMLNPSRDVPRVFLAGISSVTGLGLLVIVSFMSVLEPNEMSTASLAAPFFSRIGGSSLCSVTSILIALCAAGSANAKLAGCTRVFYSAARDHLFPSPFGRVSSRGVPFVSIVACAAWAIVLQICVPNLDQVMNYFMIGQIIVFALVGAALIRLRFTMPAPRVYKVALYPVTPIAFTLACLFLVAYSLFDPNPSTATTSRYALLLTFAGLPIYFITTYCTKLVYYLRHRWTPTVGPNVPMT